MSAYTIIALFVLAATGGVIAWLGDVIGYRLGKRRSSLFGMRPRTTARAVGVVAGVLLPLVGLGVAAWSSEYVRIALFSLQSLQEQQVDLRKQVRRLDSERTAAQSDAQQARQEATVLRTEAVGLRGEVETLRSQVNELQGELTGLQNQLASIKSQLQAANTELAQTLEKNRRLLATQRRLRSEIATWLERIADRQREVERVERRIEEAEEELALKTDRLLTVTGRLLAWQKAATGPVIYRADEEIIRGVIESDQTLEQIESSLTEYLVLASKAVRARGLVLPEGRNVRAYLPIPLGVGAEGDVAEEGIIHAVARAINDGEEDSYVVSIRTLTRVFEEQPEPRPVPVGLWPIPNRRVFAPGETIVRTEIDGAAPRDEVFGQVWAILGRLRQEAQEQGILPDRETGQYGNVPAEQILSALDELTEAGESQVVQAIAAEDVYTAGLRPFLATIRVGEVPES